MVGVECMFAWYWLADLCSREEIDFVLGHALYMKADPWRQGQERQDRLPQDRRAAARRHVSPWPTSTRRRCGPPAICCAAATYLVRKRAELLAHVQNTAIQYNLPETRRPAYVRRNRAGGCRAFSRSGGAKDRPDRSGHDRCLRRCPQAPWNGTSRKRPAATTGVRSCLLRSIHGVGQNPRPGDALRDPRHQPLRDGAGFRLLLPAGEMSATNRPARKREPAAPRSAMPI